MHKVIPKLMLAHSGFSAVQSQHRSFPGTFKMSDNILSFILSLRKLCLPLACRYKFLYIVLIELTWNWTEKLS